MRLLLITQWFDPEPFFKGLPFARALRDRGHEVEVLTGFPNYPGGTVYPGYKVRTYASELIEGIRVHRVWLYPSHDRSALRRSLNYLSFALSASLASLLVRRPDLAYVYHPPGTAAVPALTMFALRQVPFVIDIQDLWPDSVVATGMLGKGVALRPINWLCSTTYKHAKAIAVLSPGFKTALINRGVHADKVHVIPNWCDERQLPLVPGGNTTSGETFEIVYAGAMGPAQSLSYVLDAAAMLVHDSPNVRFTFVGTGIESDELARAAKKRALTNVGFEDQRPASQMGPILARADALLVHLKPNPLFSITIPSKTQAYMAAGRPILMAVDGDAADLVRKAGCGVVCSPGDPHSIAAAVRGLVAMEPESRAQMGRNGAAYYRDHLSIEVGVSRFDQLLRLVCPA